MTCFSALGPLDPALGLSAPVPVLARSVHGPRSTVVGKRKQSSDDRRLFSRDPCDKGRFSVYIYTMIKSINNWMATPKNYRWLVLYTVAVGTFMGPLDSSIVNIALPTITNYFHTDVATIQWVVMAYLITTGTLLITFGRMGDLYGHRFVYLIGIVVFTAGSLLCSLSWTVTTLVIFRMAQALGAGMMMAVGPAILTDVFEPKNRGKALGVVASSVSAGLLFGPVLGGIITDALKWQWIFYINIPIGVFTFILGYKLLKENKPAKAPRFDWLGAFLGFLTLLSLLVSLNQGPNWGWTAMPTVFLFAASIVFGALFILVETRAVSPMLDLSLFRNRLFSAANFSAMISYIAMFSMVFLMPFYLIRALQMEPSRAGMIMAAIPALGIFLAPISGMISDKIGSRWPAVVGMSLVVVGFYGLRGLSIDSQPVEIIVRLALPGIGMGIFQTPNNSAIMGSVSKRYLGIASGVISTMRSVGMVLGIAISGSVLAMMEPKYLEQLLAGGTDKIRAGRMAFVFAFHDAFLVGGVICLLAVVASLVRGPDNAMPSEQEVGRES